MKDLKPAQVQFMQVGEISTAYYRGGRGEPLVLLHGGGAGADSYGNWSGCFGRFADHFDTIAIDMVGFGLSGKPDPSTADYSQGTRTAHLVAAIEALDAGPVHLIGNSMGGLTGLGIAVERPDLVRSLVLMGSAGIRTEINPALHTIMDYDFSLEGMQRIVQALTHSEFKVDSKLVAYRHKLSVEPGTRSAYEAIQGWIRNRGGLYCEEAYIGRVNVPTLVVNGKDDKVVPVTSAYRFLELIPQSWGYIVPACGHWAMMEHPDAFARACIAFLLDTGARNRH